MMDWYRDHPPQLYMPWIIESFLCHQTMSAASLPLFNHSSTAQGGRRPSQPPFRLQITFTRALVGESRNAILCSQYGTKHASIFTTSHCPLAASCVSSHSEENRLLRRPSLFPLAPGLGGANTPPSGSSRPCRLYIPSTMADSGLLGNRRRRQKRAVRDCSTRLSQSCSI